MATNWQGLKSNDGKVSEKEFNLLVDAIQSHSLRPGPNYRLTQTVGGVTILPKGSSSGGTSCPFTVSIAPNAASPTTDIDVTITPGTLNQLLPTNIYDTFTIAKMGTFHVKLVASTDGEKVTSGAIEVDSTAAAATSPTPYSLPTTFDVTLAVIKDAASYRVIGCGSVSLFGRMQYTVEKSPAAGPGLPTVTEYYNWVALTDDL